MQKNRINTQALAEQVSDLCTQGHTIMYLAYNDKLAGAFAVNDPLRAEAAQFVKALQKLRLHVILLSGDSQKASNMIAEQVGINHIIAECLPHQKAKIIRQVQQNSGKPIMMLGDGGFNNEALAQADVGIALKRTPVLDNIAVRIDNSSLQDLITLIQLARRTFKLIKQNIVGVSIYHLLALAIASGLIYPLLHSLLQPFVALMCMSLVTPLILLNTHRLQHISLTTSEH